MKSTKSFDSIGNCLENFTETSSKKFFRYKNAAISHALGLPYLTMLYLQNQEKMTSNGTLKPLFQSKVGTFHPKIAFSFNNSGAVSFKSSTLRRFLALHAIVSTAIYQRTNGIIFVDLIEGVARPIHISTVLEKADRLLGEVAELLLDTVPNKTWAQIPPNLRVEVYNTAEKIIAEYARDVKAEQADDGTIALCALMRNEEVQSHIQSRFPSSSSSPPVSVTSSSSDSTVITPPTSLVGTLSCDVPLMSSDASHIVTSSVSNAVHTLPTSSSFSSSSSSSSFPSTTASELLVSTPLNYTYLFATPRSSTHGSRHDGTTYADIHALAFDSDDGVPGSHGVGNYGSSAMLHIANGSNVKGDSGGNTTQTSISSSSSCSSSTSTSASISAFTSASGIHSGVDSSSPQVPNSHAPLPKPEGRDGSGNEDGASGAGTSAAGKTDSGVLNTSTSDCRMLTTPRSHAPAQSASAVHDSDTTDSILRDIARIEEVYAVTPSNQWVAMSPANPWVAARRCVTDLRERMDEALLLQQSQWEVYAQKRARWMGFRHIWLREKAKAKAMAKFFIAGGSANAASVSTLDASTVKIEEPSVEGPQEPRNKKKRSRNNMNRESTGTVSTDVHPLVQLSSIGPTPTSLTTTPANKTSSISTSTSTAVAANAEAMDVDTDTDIFLPAHTRHHHAPALATTSATATTGPGEEIWADVAVRSTANGEDSALAVAPPPPPPPLPLPHPLPLLASSHADLNSNSATNTDNDGSSAYSSDCAINTTRTQTHTHLPASKYASGIPSSDPTTFPTATLGPRMLSSDKDPSIPPTTHAAIVVSEHGPTVRVMTFNMDALQCEWSWATHRLEEWRSDRGNIKQVQRTGHENDGYVRNLDADSNSRFRNQHTSHTYTNQQSHVSHVIVPLRDLHPDIPDKKKRAMAAALIYDANPDILCVTEVDTLMTLDAFNRNFLPTLEYTYSCLVETRSAMGMSVGVLSRYPILHYKLHKDSSCHLIYPKGVLEVDLDVQGTVLTVYVCHFKAMERKGANNISVNEMGAVEVNKHHATTSASSSSNSSSLSTSLSSNSMPRGNSPPRPHVHTHAQKQAQLVQQRTASLLARPHASLLAHGVVSDAILRDVGRANELRWLQATHLANIIDQRWGSVGHCGNFIILGDMNDTPTSAYLRPLMGRTEWTDVLARLSSHHRWTHCHFDRKTPKYTQLDYILPSAALAHSTRNRARVPVVLRNGLSWRVVGFQGERYAAATSANGSRASDHCPVYMDVTLLRVRAQPAIGGRHLMLSLAEPPPPTHTYGHAPLYDSNSTAMLTSASASLEAPPSTSSITSGLSQTAKAASGHAFASLAGILEAQPNPRAYAYERPKRPQFVPSLQRSQPLPPPVAFVSSAYAPTTLPPDAAAPTDINSAIACTLGALRDHMRPHPPLATIPSTTHSTATTTKSGMGAAGGADEDALCVGVVYGEVQLDHEDDVDSDIEVCEHLPEIISLDDSDGDSDEDDAETASDSNSDDDANNNDENIPRKTHIGLKSSKDGRNRSFPSRTSTIRNSHVDGGDVETGTDDDDVIYIDFGDDNELDCVDMMSGYDASAGANINTNLTSTAVPPLNTLRNTSDGPVSSQPRRHDPNAAIGDITCTDIDGDIASDIDDGDILVMEEKEATSSPSYLSEATSPSKVSRDALRDPAHIKTDYTVPTEAKTTMSIRSSNTGSTAHKRDKGSIASNPYATIQNNINSNTESSAERGEKTDIKRTEKASTKTGIEAQEEKDMEIFTSWGGVSTSTISHDIAKDIAFEEVSMPTGNKYDGDADDDDRIFNLELSSGSDNNPSAQTVSTTASRRTCSTPRHATAASNCTDTAACRNSIAVTTACGLRGTGVRGIVDGAAGGTHGSGDGEKLPRKSAGKMRGSFEGVPEDTHAPFMRSKQSLQSSWSLESLGQLRSFDSDSMPGANAGSAPIVTTTFSKTNLSHQPVAPTTIPNIHAIATTDTNANATHKTGFDPPPKAAPVIPPAASSSSIAASPTTFTVTSTSACAAAGISARVSSSVLATPPSSWVDVVRGTTITPVFAANSEKVEGSVANPVDNISRKTSSRLATAFPEPIGAASRKRRRGTDDVATPTCVSGSTSTSACVESSLPGAKYRAKIPKLASATLKSNADPPQHPSSFSSSSLVSLRSSQSDKVAPQPIKRVTTRPDKSNAVKAGGMKADVAIASVSEANHITYDLSALSDDSDIECVASVDTSNRRGSSNRPQSSNQRGSTQKTASQRQDTSNGSGNNDEDILYLD